MKRFKHKNYTIPEGHYTGPKQKQEQSAMKYATSFGIGSGIIGGARGYFDGDPDRSTVENIIDGFSGAFTLGSLTGLAAKGLAHYQNKPLTEIQFEKLDRAIKSTFGQYRIPLLDVGVGYTKEFRKGFNDRICYNDRNITNFKVNIGIKRNQITMYTFGVSDDELTKISRILDECTYQNTNMNYSSTLINKAQNSYAVYITFTKYAVIAEFIKAIAEDLGIRINILDKDAYISTRINEFKPKRTVDNTTEDVNKVVKVINNGNPVLNQNDSITNNTEERTFSLINSKSISPLSLIKDSGLSMMGLLRKIKEKVKLATVANIVGEILTKILEEKLEKEKATVGLPAARYGFSNDYLIATLEKLHYVNGYHYTVNESKGNLNMSVVRGVFMLTVEKGSNSDKIDEEVYNNDKSINRSEIDKVIVYTKYIDSRQDFEFFLKKLFSTKLTFNIINK